MDYLQVNVQQMLSSKRSLRLNQARVQHCPHNPTLQVFLSVPASESLAVITYLWSSHMLICGDKSAPITHNLGLSAKLDHLDGLILLVIPVKQSGRQSLF